MKTAFYLFLLLLSFQLSGQEPDRRFDIRFGAGTSILGSGDMLTTSFENEVNYRLNPYLATGLSLAFGRSNFGVSETASFTQGNLNFFFSPFRNTRRNDFRIGTGLSLLDVSDAYLTSSMYDFSTGLRIEEYAFDERRSFGYNIIIENTYAVTDRFLLGLKVFTQPYFMGDLNTGIYLKAGVKL